ncbi:hypothetical protein [Paraburkholderia fungorum]|uniref:hypothetical protein n=1 Tax=Paraburkholderia fungorum TaxID=134537 RepID=UPI0011C414A4|nr:hypothetical protein [Paraburkholderia fungorum]
MSRFLCLSFFAAAKKVSAAPHRGNANRPLTQQGKAKEVSAQPKQTNNKSRKGQHHKNNNQSAAQAKKTTS